MKTSSRSDKDALYLWIAQGEHAQSILKTHCRDSSKVLVKVGITSWRLGVKRVHHVAKTYGFKADVKVFHQHDRAAEVEAHILTLGEFVPGIAGDGRTEFRFMTHTEIETAVRIAHGGAARPEPKPEPPQPMPRWNWEEYSRKVRERNQPRKPEPIRADARTFEKREPMNPGIVFILILLAVSAVVWTVQ